MAKKPKRPDDVCCMEAVEVDGEPELFIVFNGTRIAKRGHPGTAQAKTWVSLEPGFAVYDKGPCELIVETRDTATIN